MKKLILLLCIGMFLISFISASVITSTILNTFSNTTNSSDTNTSSWIDWDNSLVGYWSMGDSYNATGIFDNSSNDNFGSFNGGIGTSDLTQGARGYGLEFDGVGDYVDASDSDSLDMTNAWTLSVWIKRDVINVYHSVVEKYDWVSGKGGYALRIMNTNKLIVYNIDGITFDSCGTTTTTINAGQWYHVVGTFDSSTNILTCYVNSVQEAQNTGATKNPTAGLVSLKIGAQGNNLGSFFNGSLDEVLIFNRSLSEQEIKALYDSKANKFNITIPNQEGTHNYKLFTIGGNGNLTTIDITETTDRIYNKNIYLDSANNWTSSLTQPSWNYSSNLDFKILNETKHTIFKLDEDGNLAIAGNLYENTNSPPPSANILWSFNNLFWLDDYGNFYINKLYELIIG